MLHLVRNDDKKQGGAEYPIKRVYEHKYADVPGFTQKHGCKHLVYYELIEDMLSAIAREKQLKGGSRKKKLALIEKVNPYWEDLYEKLM